MTTALTATAKELLSVQRKDVRKGRVDVEAAWTELDRFERFKILDALGSQVLPVLVALPDVEVSRGERPTFTDQQVVAAVEQCLGEGGGRLRRKAAVATRAAMVRRALHHLPPRSGLDTLDVPDSP